jgi:hypothetical protein
MRLWAQAPEEVDGVIEALIAKRRRRPVSAEEMANQLAQHFPRLAATWRTAPLSGPKLLTDC